MTRHERLPAHTPTQEAYAELQHAYDYFNRELFKGELPPCLITLQRIGSRCAGYFSAERFAASGDRKTDEIAMNPQHFRQTPKWQMQGLQTLCHEMCHLWQHHFGKNLSRKSYHNAEWSEKMEAIGLMPSSTGAPGGKKTGQTMGDYPIPGGRFEVAAKALIADQGFRFTWRDRSLELREAADAAAAGEGEEGEEGEAEPKEKKSGKRIKYTCTGAGEHNAWGKDDLELYCKACEAPFERAD